MVLVVAFCVALLAFAPSAFAQSDAEPNVQPNRVHTISIAPPVAQKSAPRTATQKSAQPSDHLDGLVAKHAAAHGLPESLVRRVIKIESGGNPRVVSKGNFGLMQIRLGTARSMGYAGDSDGLLDADTNMTYAVRYLAGAYRTAGGNPDRAVALYQRGYYHEAKAKGLSPYAPPARQAPVLASVEPAAPVAVSREPAAVVAPRPAKRAAPVVPAREPAVVVAPPVVATRTPVVAVAPPVVAVRQPVVAAAPPVVTVREPALAAAPPVVAAREPVVAVAPPVETPVAPPQPEPKQEAALAPAPVAAPGTSRKGDRLEVAKPDLHAALQAEPAPAPAPTPSRHTRAPRVEEPPRSLFNDLKAEIAHAQAPGSTPLPTAAPSRRSKAVARRDEAARQKAGKPFDLSTFFKQFANQETKPAPRRRTRPQAPSQPPS